jgi:hypothetical protein
MTGTLNAALRHYAIWLDDSRVFRQRKCSARRPSSLGRREYLTTM